MGQRRPAVEPQLVCCFVVQGGSGGEVGEVGGCSAELIPQRGRGIACETHSAGLAKDCPVDTFGTAILSRCVGGSDNMVDAKRSTPLFHGIGD
jgi:hypothetical protein